MKKLVVFAVALIAAVMSQAASLDWRYTATKNEVDQTVYVMLGATAQVDWDSLDTVSAAAISSGKVSASGRNYFATGKVANDGITKDSASIYYVVVSADGGTYDVTSVSDMKASVYDPANQESSPGSNTSLTPSSITVSGKSFGGNPPPGPTPGDTPEPTSGLLLLVGGAVLALRRKQK